MHSRDLRHLITVLTDRSSKSPPRTTSNLQAEVNLDDPPADLDNVPLELNMDEFDVVPLPDNPEDVLVIVVPEPSQPGTTVPTTSPSHPVIHPTPCHVPSDESQTLTLLQTNKENKYLKFYMDCFIVF